MTWQLIHADCLEAMAAMDEASVDAVVCDPPYGLEFMGKEWDRLWADVGAGKSDHAVATGRPSGRRGFDGYGVTPSYKAGIAAQTWHAAWATEALRVLKPGAHLLAFGGTRTFHRLACALEDAGFEIRDCLAWLYGSGFPKSLDVSKAIDKAAGAEREVYAVQERRPRVTEGPTFAQADKAERFVYSHPATPEAERWQGWGTALKPAFEPIVLARKPLVGSVATNVERFGTGALNIDGARIGERDESKMYVQPRPTTDVDGASWSKGEHVPFHYGESGGRWPANVVLDPEAAAMLDAQTGERPSSGGAAFERVGYEGGWGSSNDRREIGYGDTGGASRFFYCPKADREERDRGLEGFAEQNGGIKNDSGRGYSERDPYAEIKVRNPHPTVKPVELMRWLVKLITPPGGVVLDPFTGSGSTGIAALREGFDFIGIEREADYVEIARARIQGDAPLWNVPMEVV